MSESRKRKKAILLLLLLSFGVAGVILSAIVASHIHDRGYPVAPAKFYRQADGIPPGISSEEAIKNIEYYSEIRDDKENNTVRIVLKPSTHGIVFRNHKYINIEYDVNGCVTRVYKSDG